MSACRVFLYTCIFYRRGSSGDHHAVAASSGHRHTQEQERKRIETRGRGWRRAKKYMC